MTTQLDNTEYWSTIRARVDVMTAVQKEAWVADMYLRIDRWTAEEDDMYMYMMIGGIPQPSSSSTPSSTSLGSLHDLLHRALVIHDAPIGQERSCL